MRNRSNRGQIELQPVSDFEIRRKAQFLDSLSSAEMAALLERVKPDTKIQLWEILTKKT